MKELVTAASVSDQGVFGLLKRLEDGLLVLGECGIRPSFSASYLRVHAAQVKCSPGDAGADGVEATSARAQSIERLCGISKTASKRHLGKIVADRHADLGVRSGQLALCHPDVGSLTEQRSWVA